MKEMDLFRILNIQCVSLEQNYKAGKNKDSEQKHLLFKLLDLTSLSFCLMNSGFQNRSVAFICLYGTN